MAINYIDFAKKIKEQYPYYNDIEDKVLAEKIIEKYPYYKDKVTFEELPKPTQSMSLFEKIKQKFGIGKPPEQTKEKKEEIARLIEPKNVPVIPELIPEELKKPIDIKTPLPPKPPPKIPEIRAAKQEDIIKTPLEELETAKILKDVAERKRKEEEELTEKYEYLGMPKPARIAFNIIKDLPLVMTSFSGTKFAINKLAEQSPKIASTIMKNPKLSRIAISALSGLPYGVATTDIEIDESVKDVVEKYPKNIAEAMIGFALFDVGAQITGTAINKALYKNIIEKLPATEITITKEDVSNLYRGLGSKDIEEISKTFIGWNELAKKLFRGELESARLTVPNSTVEKIVARDWFKKFVDITKIPELKKLTETKVRIKTEKPYIVSTKEPIVKEEFETTEKPIELLEHLKTFEKPTIPEKPITTIEPITKAEPIESTIEPEKLSITEFAKSESNKYYNKGIEALSNKQIEDALDYFQKAIDYNRNNIDAWKGLGDTLKEQRNIELASKALEVTKIKEPSIETTKEQIKPQEQIEEKPEVVSDIISQKEIDDFIKNKTISQETLNKIALIKGKKPYSVGTTEGKQYLKNIIKEINQNVVKKPEIVSAETKVEPIEKTIKSITSKKNIPTILNNFKVENGKVIASDNDIIVEYKTNIADGMYKFVGNDILKSNVSPNEHIKPEPETKFKEKVGTVDNSILIKKIKKIQNFIDTKGESGRDVFKNAYLNIENGKAQLVATNCRKINIENIDIKNAKDGKYIFTPDVIKGLKSLSGKIDIKLLKEKDKPIYISFSSSNGRVYTRLVRGDYANYKNIFRLYEYQIVVNRDDLEKAIKELIPYAKFNTITKRPLAEFVIDKENNTLNLTSGIKENSKTIKIPIEIKQISYEPKSGVMIAKEIFGKEEEIIVISLNYLKDALDAFDKNSDKIYIGMKDLKPDKIPIHISDEDLSLSEQKPEQKPEQEKRPVKENKNIKQYGYVEYEIPAPESQVSEQTISDGITKKSDIIKYITEKLEIPIRYGLFKGKPSGIYKIIPSIIRLKIGKEENIEVVAHEIGHYLSDKIVELRNIIKNNEELKKLDYEPLKERAEEGFAEFLKFYIINRTEVRNKAPQFYNAFEAIMGTSNNREIKDILDNVGIQYKKWKEMPSVAKVESKISFDAKKPINLTFEDIYTKIFDDLNPLHNYTKIAREKGLIKKAEEDPYTLARLLRGWVGKANHFIEYKTFEPNSLEITGEGLKEILSPVSKNKALNNFSVYLISKRAKELNQRGITTGIETADANKAIEDLEKKYPEFNNIANKIYDYQDRLLQYVKNCGLFDDETYNDIKKLNQYYVPFHRIVEHMQRKGYLGKTLANISNPIKRIRGSDLEIVDPLESIIKNTYVFINTAERNRVGVAVVRLASLDPQLGRMVEEVSTPMAKVAMVKAEDLFSEKEKEDILLSLELQNKIIPDILDRMIDVFRPSIFIPNENIITVLVDGKKRYFQVDAELYKAMLNMGEEDVSMLTKILSYPARALRAGATLSPEFLGRNPFKDQVTAYLYSKYGYKPFIDIWGGIASLIKKDELFYEWLRSGGAHSALISMDRDYIRKRLQDLFINKKMINPLEALRVLSEIGDQVTRIGEYKLGRLKGKSPLESAMSSREVTIDFARKGSAVASINKIIAFFNAQLQGVDRFARELKNNPKIFFAKITAGIVIPSIAIYMLNRKSKRYDNLPQYEKDLYWIIDPNVIGIESNRLVKIPKPFEIGVIFGSGTERFLRYIDKKDPKVLDKYEKSLMSALTPSFIPTLFTPIIENYTNYSFFKDRPIESINLRRLIPEERYYNYTPTSVRWLGKQTGLSPLKIENLVRGYFGGLGSLIINMPDIAMKSLGKSYFPLQSQDIPLIKAFVSQNPYGFTSEIAIKFYDDYEKIEQYYNIIKDLKRLKRFEEVENMKKKYPKYKFYPIYQMTNIRLAEIRKKQENILNDEKLTPKEKQSKINYYDKKIIKIIENLNKSIENRR